MEPQLIFELLEDIVLGPVDFCAQLHTKGFLLFFYAQ